MSPPDTKLIAFADIVAGGQRNGKVARFSGTDSNGTFSTGRVRLQLINIAFNTQEGLLAELAKNPSRAQRFAEAMSFFNTGRGYEPQYLLDSYT